MKRRFVIMAVAMLVAWALPLAAVSADGTHPGLTPDTVEENIALGGSFDVTKTVHTPEIPPEPEIYFLVDTTGSMGLVIGQIQTDIGLIIGGVTAQAPNAEFGLGEYKDFPFDAFAFNHRVSIGPDDGPGGGFDVSDDVGSLSATGGNDGPEGQFFALDQLAEAANPAGFTAGASNIIVWIGDAPAHDPVCAAISALGYDITEASVTAKLQAPLWGGTGLSTVALSVITAAGAFYPNALDDIPTNFGGDYLAACGAENGADGQATRIANATGGVHLTGVLPADIAQAILDAVGSVEVEVSMASNCSDPITTSFAPASQTVTSGDDAFFTETITVAGDAAPGAYECEDWALIDGDQMVDDAGALIVEDKTITVVAATCDPTENPHGNTKPVAPGNGGQGQNQDGFYQIGSTSGEAVFVVDDGSGAAFGPFPSGSEIKYTEDDDAVPSVQAMGANNGGGNNGNNQGNDTDVHVIGNGDALVVYIDGFGNVTVTACLVPPPPK